MEGNSREIEGQFGDGPIHPAAANRSQQKK
jgi:hypothetical protein